MSSFLVQLGNAAIELEGYLIAVLDREQARGAPEKLIAALRHAMLGGGKRFRPFLVIKCAELFGISRSQALPAAAAIECIHCYSLVHDDLPSMDNDEIRRGQPTVWKAFDEWTAILAGDALQALAFEILSDTACHEDAAIRAALVHALAKASGAGGMVGGQVMDLEAGQSGAAPASTVEYVTRLQAMKTGRLIVAACEMGAILGNASNEQRNALKTFAEHLGVAFQISDDLLDAEGQAATVGKATGKDAAAGKATLVALLGTAPARDYMDKTVADAIAALAPFAELSVDLADAARFIGRRSN